MTEVVSIKFKIGGKNYFFSPSGIQIQQGEKVIVETSKGLEMAECSRGNHFVEDTAVVLPLRPVVRIASERDLTTAAANKAREKEALEICRAKVAEHKLEMKLVDVECSFDGSKTTFFFTADGRVDFRDLVKDLASVFHNRIELRQIGVRDEAKMIGGLGICGRPYCCSQFLGEFAPVSTKMAKVQNLPLNPTKISGSCGRLMCCLRYEEDAYEALVKKVPKQGAFVETVDGYGTAVSVNLLRGLVKVRLDQDSDDELHEYKAAQVAAVPGGRPKEGEPLPKVLQYVPEEEEETVVPLKEEDPWHEAVLFAAESSQRENSSHAREFGVAQDDNYKDVSSAPSSDEDSQNKSHRNSHHRKKRNPISGDSQNAPVKKENPSKEQSEMPAKKSAEEKPISAGEAAQVKAKKKNRSRYYHHGPKKQGGNNSGNS